MTVDGLTLTLETSDGTSLTWELATLTNAPEGKFLALDSDGQPRLLIDGEELATFQKSTVGGGRP